MRNARISGVYQQGPSDPPVGEEARRRNNDLKREAWHRFGLLVIDPEDVNNDFDRQQLINIANKMHGHRRAKK